MKQNFRISRLILIGIGVLSVSRLVAFDVLVQSRIKGAMMGSGLGDAFARVVNNRIRNGEILAKPIESFEDFKHDDWVYDSEKCNIGIGTENMIIVLNQFEALIEGRRKGLSKEQLIKLCSRSLVHILHQHNHESDPFYECRRFRSETLQKIKQLTSSSWFKNPIKIEDDAHALIRVIPLGIVFSDNIDMVKQLADLHVQLTDRQPATRVAGVALAVGIAHAINNSSVDEIIQRMIEAAEECEARFNLNSNENISEYIRQAQQEALQGTDPAQLLGTKLAARTSTYGRWIGYTAREALASAVFCFVRNKGALKGALHDSVHAEGNNEVVATLAGALAGAKTGFWELTKQGYMKDIEMIEKVNVLQAACNDTYVILSDYPPYNGHDSRQRGISKIHLLIGAGLLGTSALAWYALGS